MKYLQQTWIRFVVSLLIASFTLEIVNINSSAPNQPASTDSTSIFILVFGVIIFFVLTAIVKKKTKTPFK